MKDSFAKSTKAIVEAIKSKAAAYRLRDKAVSKQACLAKSMVEEAIRKAETSKKRMADLSLQLQKLQARIDYLLEKHEP
ncbi:hypothetical protein [Spirosoma koreense]